MVSQVSACNLLRLENLCSQQICSHCVSPVGAPRDASTHRTERCHWVATQDEGARSPELPEQRDRGRFYKRRQPRSPPQQQGTWPGGPHEPERALAPALARHLAPSSRPSPRPSPRPSRLCSPVRGTKQPSGQRPLPAPPPGRPRSVSCPKRWPRTAADSGNCALSRLSSDE